MTTTETNGHVELLPTVQMPPCIEWEGISQPHRSFTMHRRNGLWVAAKMGVYRDLDAVAEKINQTIRYYDGDDIYSIRLELGVLTTT